LKSPLISVPKYSGNPDLTRYSLLPLVILHLFKIYVLPLDYMNKTSASSSIEHDVSVIIT